MITEFDWNEFSALPVLPPPNEITFLPFSIGSHLICELYGNDKRDESLSLPPDDSLKEITANRIDLQFCLLQSICGQSAANIYLDSRMSKSDLFRTVLPFSYCYHFVQLEQRNGILFGIAASGLNTSAREIFLSLFKLRQLNPFIAFCAERIFSAAYADHTDITGKLSIYEIKDSKSSYQMSEDIVDFTNFLVNQKRKYSGAVILPLYGYFLTDLLQSEAIVFLLGKFSRVFYVEETATKLSRGFYFL